MTAQLRAMRWWDLDAVMALERELFDDAWSVELFWSELAQHETRHYLVAEDDARIVGYAGLAAFPEEGYVQTLAVAPDAQRGGLGTRLLLALMAEARRRRLPRVGLEVRVDNTGAQALYRRFGFAPVGLRRGYYQATGTDGLVMMADDVDQPAYAERLARITAGQPRAGSR